VKLARVIASLGAIAAVLSLCTSLCATPADAQRRRVRGGETSTDRRAQELFHRGDVLYAQGRYEDAILAFQEAYLISERPLLLYNIANAEERLGRWAEALGMLQRYLPSAEPTERADVEQRIHSIEIRLARERALAAEQRRVRESEQARARTQVQAPGPPIAGWVLVIGGGAAVGAGVAFGLVALGARNEAEPLCHMLGDSRLCAEEAKGALGRDVLFSVLADASVIVGVAAATVGVAVIVSAGSRSEPERRRLHVRLGPRGVGAEVGVALEL